MKVRLIPTLIFSFSLLLPSLCKAQTVGTLKETFCGSGLTKLFVPDRFLTCDFSEACKKHDICYGRCDPDGDLYGSNYCSLSESSPQRSRSKEQCDEDLKNHIAQNNHNNSFCSRLGAVYKFAVSKLGQGPFNGREINEMFINAVDISDTPEQATELFNTFYELRASGTVDYDHIRFENEQILLPTRRNIPSNFQKSGNILIIPNNTRPEELRQLRSVIEP